DADQLASDAGFERNARGFDIEPAKGKYDRNTIALFEHPRLAQRIDRNGVPGRKNTPRHLADDRVTRREEALNLTRIDDEALLADQLVGKHVALENGDRRHRQRQAAGVRVSGDREDDREAGHETGRSRLENASH